MASSIRFGQYDDPPASQSRARRSRLNHAPADMSDLHDTDPSSTHPSSPRRAYLGPLQRRRQRSPTSSSEQGISPSGEELRRRRSKRRKLDADLPRPTPPIKYGHYGQVQSGKLKLEVISCDGGEHRDPRHPSTYLGPQNLLRHDKSVYCSEKSDSAIVLRHADDTPFCLDKLHIVGPEHGFTAPVREGLVYVAMSLNDLSKYLDPPRHARMSGIHSPPYRRSRSFRSPPEQITLADALRDPEISAAFDDREQRSRARNGESTDAYPESRIREYNYGAYREDSEMPCDLPSSADSFDAFAVSQAMNLPIALLSDEEPGPEEHSTQEVLDFRLQRLQNMRRRFDVDNYDREERWSRMNDPYDGNDRDRESSWNLGHLDTMMARSRMADSPQREELGEEQDRSDTRTSPRIPGSSSYYYSNADQSERLEFCQDGSQDPDVTRARFFIQRGKYKVAIKFDPPVSGRFILLKLWAHRSNVDVQSIIAKGYGGPRFFPAVELR